MNTLILKDGAAVGFHDFGSGQPLVFPYGWQFSGEALSTLMLFFCRKGYRAIAYGGRCDANARPLSAERRADELAEVIEHLNLTNIIMVGHPADTEIARYLTRHGSKRVAKIVVIDTGRDGLGAPACTQADTGENAGGFLEQERAACARTGITYARTME